MKRKYVKAAMSIWDITTVSLLALSKIPVNNASYEIENDEDILVKGDIFEDNFFEVK